MIAGIDFLPGAVVLFGGEELPTSSLSDRQLEARVPKDLVLEGGATEIRVRNPKGELSAPARFLIIDDPPNVNSITPRKTGTGAVDLEVTIRGQRFQRGATMEVNDRTVESTVVDSTTLQARLSDSFFQTAAELKVRVLNADGNRSNHETIQVSNGPLITRLSNSHLREGSGPTRLIVQGIAFASEALIEVNGVPAPTEFVSETELGVRIGEELTAVAGTLLLQVRNPDGGRSNEVRIRVRAR
jgi:hypothetical protein